ncbi:protein fuzzy homolog [Phlebotomus papatasi]|uniref:protein fuzzy homolog n=1 Tax=Phlebotomus papatasi TaxID=29031 RepID=UPI002483F786|nr:protein fuzzy homolog [Phlebotomus papatasi]
MSIQLICLTLSGGIPIFTRKKGEGENLSFSTIGSLNGVHMFCKSQGQNLRSTSWEDGLLVWEEFADTFLIIGFGRGVGEKVLRKLINSTYSALVFTVGLPELQNFLSVERLKRELLPCLGIIDHLIESADCELIGFTDCILCPQNATILEKLGEFCDQFGSAYACLMIRQRIAAATEGWWDLDVGDRQLLSTLIATSSSLQKDTPVFLPQKSPSIAYRLVSIPILQNINMCLLCGAEPPYRDIEVLTHQIWRTELKTLELAEQCFPRNFPNNLELDPGILGILLINRPMAKYVISRNIQQSSTGKRTVSGTHRLDILRTFFHQAVDMIEDYIGNLATHSESYWCSDYHKCHALIQDQNLICILYVAAIPTHTMRLITQKTLEAIVASKDTFW